MKDIALLPPSASTVADQVDYVTFGLLIICGAMVLLVFGLIFYFGVKYRRGSRSTREISERGETLLEWGWTGATALVFVGLFFWGARIYFRMHTPPEGSLEISVIGKQWMWYFQHPDGKRELNELHVPIGQPVLLTMTSQDVIHSFYVPAFRVKQDVLPGRYVYTWFQANRIGTYHLFCTQYCGLAHSDMGGHVIVMSQADYARWREGITGKSATGPIQLRQVTPVQLGSQLFHRLGCVTCHVQGKGVIAPDLGKIYGTTVQLNDGRTVRADDTYLRDHILNPRAWLVRGFQPVMPSFKGQVNEEDLLNLIAYIKSLNGKLGLAEGSQP